MRLKYHSSLGKKVRFSLLPVVVGEEQGKPDPNNKSLKRYLDRALLI